MKISQKQSELLAKEVLKSLKAAKAGEVPPHVIEQVRKFKEKRKKLLDVCKIHDEALRSHESTWKSIVGAANDEKIYYSDNLDKIVEKLKEREVPRLSVIQDEIILNAMFASDDDLQTFINKIVKKFEKKTRNKILSN